MIKTRPAPLGATYKPDVRPSRLSSRPDVAPSGADRALFNPSYKDFAPTELCRGIAKGDLWVTTLESVEQNQTRIAVGSITDQTSVNSVSLW
jgi:hypothetical protein